MRNIDRLFSINYLPTDQDVLHASVRTTGVIETLLYCNEIDYHIFDVGGPRRERKKWVHAFGAVNCLIFVAALGAFDSCLIECKEQVSKLLIQMLRSDPTPSEINSLDQDSDERSGTALSELNNTKVVRSRSDLFVPQQNGLAP